MSVDTEAAMSALFALLDPLTQFKTKSRRLQFVEDMGAESLPAVFQNQISREDLFAQTTVFAADFAVEWYVYCFQGNEQAPSTPILNPLVDAVLDALPPEGSRLTMPNGEVITVFRAGPAHYFEGLLGERAVARIPIKIKVPRT